LDATIRPTEKQLIGATATIPAAFGQATRWLRALPQLLLFHYFPDRLDVR
jgi:hypothetical protein